MPIKNIHNTPCQNYLDRFRNLRADLNHQTADTIEDYTGEVRSFYDEVRAATTMNPQCNYLLGQIDTFENGELKDKMDELLSM
jgi:hypothetical protein